MLCNHMKQNFAASAGPKVHFIWQSDSPPPAKCFMDMFDPKIMSTGIMLNHISIHEVPLHVAEIGIWCIVLNTYKY